MKEIILRVLENSRGCNLESNNDSTLGKYWASLGDIFINDAFATCHRSHAYPESVCRAPQNSRL